MASSSEAHLEILANTEALAHHVADWLVATAAQGEGPFAVALSGGETPRRLYELLASRPFRGAFPWERTHWFWGDERFVPHDDPESNYRMVRQAMLADAPIPPANIIPWRLRASHLMRRRSPTSDSSRTSTAHRA